MHRQRPIILIFPFGLLSHYLRCLVLCRHLRSYFDVRIAYHASFASFIDQENINTFQCEALNAVHAVQAVKNFDFSWINETVLEQVYHEQVGVIKKIKPVAVLGDHALTLKMAAEKTSVVFIALLNGYMTKYYAGQRSISRTHPAYKLLKMFPPSLATLLTKQGEASAFRQIHKPFKKIRQTHHLQTQNRYLDELEGDLTLLCDLPDLFPQKEMASYYHITGPLLYKPPLSTGDPSSWLDKRKKTILASMGSTGDWHKLSFLNDPYYERYNVVAAGDHARILNSSHIIHHSFVNMHELFPFTDLVICHGGNGTIYQAMLSQIPVLCKTSHCEQEWNIDTVEKMKLGKSLDGISDDDDYRKLCREWIQKKGNHHFKINSEKIKNQILQLPLLVKEIANIILKEIPVLSKNKHPLDAA